MVIDLSQLPGDIAYDEGGGLVTVSAATDLDSLQTALAAHGRSIPTASGSFSVQRAAYVQDAWPRAAADE
jgi:FAD/FMN-containing dehydrogenase